VGGEQWGEGGCLFLCARLGRWEPYDQYYCQLVSLPPVLSWSGTDAETCSISAANDLATLFPRWFVRPSLIPHPLVSSNELTLQNIRRGQILTSLMCFAFAPWQVLSSAGSFVRTPSAPFSPLASLNLGPQIAFMASYAVVLAPIASILVVDFFIVKRGAIHVPMLYDPQGIYRYSYGCNWRAALALVIAVAPNMPGMVNALNPSIDIGGAKCSSFPRSFPPQSSS
jgi:NCS1 family nucleobase:cation symporter-1